MQNKIRLAQVFINDESGQSAVIVALLLGGVLLTFTALGIDVVNLFHMKRMAQNAADAAAVSAAKQFYLDGESITASTQTVANQTLALNQFDPSATVNPATVTINRNPSTGNYTSGNYLEAVVSKPVHTYFMSLMNSSWSTVTVSARAVAGFTSTTQPAVSICLEGTSGDVLNVSNGASITALNSSIVDDSTSSNSATVVGSGSISAGSLQLVSTSWTSSSNVNNGGTLNSTTTSTGATACHTTMPTAPTVSGCVSDPLSSYGNGGSSYTVSAGCYTSLTIGANGDTVTLSPGIYVINGGELHFEYGANSKSNLGGSGVFFYLTNGASFVIDNGANVNLSAMTSGTYSGILVYQNESDSNTLSLQGGSSSVFDGAIYAPGAQVNLANGSQMTVTGAITAQSLVLAGGGKVVATPVNGASGTTTYGTVKLVE